VTLLESFGEGVGAVLSADIPGTSVNVAFGLGVGAAILGGIYLARQAFKGALSGGR
jgi:hypothetical protein